MNDPKPASRPFSILVCFDYTDAGGYAFEQAASIVKRLPSSEMHLIHVTSGDTSDARVRQVAGQLRAYVDAKAASIGGMGGMSVGVHVRHGDPVREMAELRRRGRYRPHRDRHPEARESKELDFGHDGREASSALALSGRCCGSEAYRAPCALSGHCARMRGLPQGACNLTRLPVVVRPPRFVRPPWRFGSSLFVPARATVRFTRLRSDPDRYRLLNTTVASPVLGAFFLQASCRREDRGS